MSSWRAVALRGLAIVMLSAAPAGAPAQEAKKPNVRLGETLGPMPSAGLKEVPLAKDAFSLGDPVPAWVEPAALPEINTSLPKPPSIAIRLADTQFMVADQPVVHIRSAITVNDAAQMTEAGRISISFVPQYQRVQLHGVTVVRGGERLDRTSTSTVRFLQREKGLEQGIYSDVVTASILVDDLRVGDTLDYAYSLSGQNPVFAGKFADFANWDPPGPTLLRRVVLNHPENRKISWRAVGSGRGAAPVPEESVSGSMRKLRFQAGGLIGSPEEPGIPPDHIPNRILQFSEFQSWDDVVSWAGGLFEVVGALPDELRQAVERIKVLPTAEERVAGALAFVQSEIRYFSVSLGENSHRPAPPDVVLQRRYGDCKDKSTLLVALLGELGIESHPVLLKSGGRKLLDGLLPGPQFFDHAIVQAVLPGGTYYLDPTRLGQYGRLDRMGQIHEGTRVLVIAKGNSELSTITSANAADLARSEVAEKAAMTRLGGDGQLTVRQVWNGVNAEMMRVVLEQVPGDQLAKAFGNVLEPRYPGARVTGEPKVEDDRQNNALAVTTDYVVPSMAFERDGNWFVRFAPTNLQGVLVPFPSASRTSPMFLPMFPFNGAYTFEVKFPDEVSVMSDPRGESVKSKLFTLASSTTFRGSLSKTRITMRTLADRIEPKDFAKYSEDVRSIDKVITGAVIVPKPFVRSKGSAVALKTELAKSLRERQLASIDTATNAIKSGRLAETERVAVFCERSAAQSNLGKHDIALKDANEAMKAMPSSGEAVVCRASAYFGAGQFDKSVEDYTGALSLGVADPRMFHQRGISKFYAGNLADAADDFARASAAIDDEFKVFSDLWLGWTLQRLGRPLPDDLVERAAVDPQGDWPRPALATLAGHMTPEDLLKVLDGKLGDERQMAMAEGYFVLGQYYFARGDRVKAKEYFEKTRQLQIISYTEHIAAGFELAALAAPVPIVTGALPVAAKPAPAAALPAAPTPLVAAAPAAPPVAVAPAVVGPAQAAGPVPAVAPSPAPQIATVPPGPPAAAPPPTAPAAPATTAAVTPAVAPPPAAQAAQAEAIAPAAPAATAPAATVPVQTDAAAADVVPPAAVPPKRKKRRSADDPNWNTKPLGGW